MKITTISIGKSVQVFQIGMPERWHKCTISADLEENENPEQVIDELFKVVDAAHEKYSKSIIEPNGKPSGDIYFNVTKQKEERI